MSDDPRPHDMGGAAAGPVDPASNDHAHEPWEKTVDAVVRLLAEPKRRMLSVDELRRGIEDLGPGAYDQLSYYERWIASTTENLIAKGVITVEELGRRMEEVQDEWQRRK